jgi:hypothetical protein
MVVLVHLSVALWSSIMATPASFDEIKRPIPIDQRKWH